MTQAPEPETPSLSRAKRIEMFGRRWVRTEPRFPRGVNGDAVSWCHLLRRWVHPGLRRALTPVLRMQNWREHRRETKERRILAYSVEYSMVVSSRTDLAVSMAVVALTRVQSEGTEARRVEARANGKASPPPSRVARCVSMFRRTDTSHPVARGPFARSLIASRRVSSRLAAPRPLERFASPRLVSSREIPERQPPAKRDERNRSRT